MKMREKIFGKLIHKVKKITLAGCLALTTAFSSACGDDMFKGVRGPTNWQLDERVIYHKNENDIEVLTNNLILKYWDGENFGKWGFVSLPYKYIDSPKGSNNGLGNISVGLGPRGRMGNFHWFLYSALTFPTGNSDKAALGNERLDTKIGLLATYLTSNKKFEIDGMLEYNFTGENKKDINPLNEIHAALLIGGKITNKIRFATGLTDLIRENGDFLLNSRSIVRYTVSPKLHFEIVGDIGVDEQNIPQGTSVGLFMRYNF